jgi:hypothetical protein
MYALIFNPIATSGTESLELWSINGENGRFGLVQQLCVKLFVDPSGERQIKDSCYELVVPRKRPLPLFAGIPHPRTSGSSDNGLQWQSFC